MIRTKVAVCLSLSLFLIACGEQPTAENHLAKANKFYKESKFKESEIELKNAIKLAPKNAEARFSIGKLYLMQGDGLSAVKELEKAKELKYLPNKLIPLLARAYLISEDYDGVLGLSENSEKLANEEKALFLSYKTLAAIRTKQKELAEETISAVNELSPGSANTVLANGYLALLNNNIEKAEMLVNKSLSIDSENAEAVMFQGQVYGALGDFEKAGESYKKYLALQPQSKIIYLILADTLVKTKNYLEAEKYADAILKVLPNQPVANYTKAVIRFAEKDYKLAKQFAEKVLLTQYKKPHMKLVAGASAFHLNNYEQANFYLEGIVQHLAANHPARKMFAVSQFQLGLIGDIAETLKDYQPSSEADEQFMSSLSFSLYSVGAKQEARVLADKAGQQKDTQLSNARTGILQVLMDDPDAIEKLEQSIRDTPNQPGIELALAYASMQARDYVKALKIVKQWQEKSPENIDGYNMLAAIYIQSGDDENAEKSLKHSLLLDENNLFANTELAKFYFQRGNIAQAQEFSKKAIALYPENPKALRYYYAVNKNPEALAKIESAYEADKRNNELAVLYMEALLDSDNLKRFVEVSDGVTNSIKTPKKVWQLRVRAYQKLKQSGKVKETLVNWHKTNAYHEEPVFLLADFYTRVKDYTSALEVVNKALEGHHANNLNLKMVKMQLLLDVGEKVQAKQLLPQLENQSIAPVILTGIKGRINLLEKNYGMAVEQLTPFYNKFKSSQNAILLAVAMQQADKVDDAVSLLSSHLTTKKTDHRVRNMLANLYLGVNSDNAMAQYKILIEAQPRNIVALNNLAWLTMEKGELAQAKSYSEQAVKIAPKMPNVLDTYSQILVKVNDLRAAYTNSKQAYELTKGKDVDIALNYIEILLLNSRKNEAMALLSKVQPQTDSQKEKTKRLLNKI